MCSDSGKTGPEQLDSLIDKVMRFRDPTKPLEADVYSSQVNGMFGNNHKDWREASPAGFHAEAKDKRAWL